jgi:hypothetical protein
MFRVFNIFTYILDIKQQRQEPILNNQDRGICIVNVVIKTTTTELEKEFVMVICFK